MKLFGKEISDESSRCGDVLDCELFRKGHGIGGNRENVADMIKCQFEHKAKKENK